MARPAPFLRTTPSAFVKLDTFERYTPLPDLEKLMADRPNDLHQTVRRVYGALVAAATQEPRVMPALIADLFGNPTGPALPVWEQAIMPRMLASVGGWLSEEIQAGRIHPLALPLLIQLLIGPLAAHVLTRPALESVAGAADLPSLNEACDVFTDSFLRAVATPG